MVSCATGAHAGLRRLPPPLGEHTFAPDLGSCRGGGQALYLLSYTCVLKTNVSSLSMTI
jgi:hypothetical protein